MPPVKAIRVGVGLFKKTPWEVYPALVKSIKFAFKEGHWRLLAKARLVQSNASA